MVLVRLQTQDSLLPHSLTEWLERGVSGHHPVLGTAELRKSGMQVTLVKKWREAITEVSDQQSLAASLQQSAYYSHFRDHIDGWAGRLCILQVCSTQLI